MKSPFHLPWASTGGRKAVPAEKTEALERETKMAAGFAIVAGEGAAHWSGRSYAALARTGVMKNPVAYRAMRMIAEAAAAVPWLAYERIARFFVASTPSEVAESTFEPAAPSSSDDWQKQKRPPRGEAERADSGYRALSALMCST
jgi:hypothetical protein